MDSAEANTISKSITFTMDLNNHILGGSVASNVVTINHSSANVTFVNGTIKETYSSYYAVSVSRGSATIQCNVEGGGTSISVSSEATLNVNGSANISSTSSIISSDSNSSSSD